MRRFANCFLLGLFTSFAVSSLPFASATKVEWKDGCETHFEDVRSNEEIATDAGLHYLDERKPGISRKSVGNEFIYRDPKDRVITSPATLEWIKSLAIPVAYRDVWISTDRESHLLAYGFAANGKKQYKYHPKWNAAKSEIKYGKLEKFGNVLVDLRKTTERDLAKRGLDPIRVHAGITEIMDETSIRIGNPGSTEPTVKTIMVKGVEKDAATFGLTTFEKRHVSLTKDSVTFTFAGKSHKDHSITLKNPAIVSLVKELLKLPGTRLFQTIDESGVVREVTADAVNQYIRTTTGGPFSAKFFRTWNGTKTAIRELTRLGAAKTPKEIAENIRLATVEASEALGNTPAICRDNYIHPLVFSVYENPARFERLVHDASRDGKNSELAPEERFILQLLK